MRITDTKLNNLYSLHIMHDIWNECKLVLVESDSSQHIFNIVDIKDNQLFGNQTIDNGSYIGTDGDFLLLGTRDDFPEYWL